MTAVKPIKQMQALDSLIASPPQDVQKQENQPDEAQAQIQTLD